MNVFANECDWNLYKFLRAHSRKRVVTNLRTQKGMENHESHE